MDIKTLFPLFHQQGGSPSDNAWDEEFDFSEASCRNLRSLWLKIMIGLGQDYENHIGQTTAICQDLLNIHGSHPEHRTLLLFLQFQFATDLTTSMGTRKMFNELFQWITNAIGNDLSFGIQKETVLGRIADFHDSEHPYVKSSFHDSFFKWTQMLFYQHRVRGGLRDVVRDYIETFFPYLKGLPGPMYDDDNLVSAFCQIQSWASNNGLLEVKDACSDVLLYFLSRTWMPISGVKLAAMQFCFCGWERTDKSQQEWCAFVMEEINLNQFEHLQVLATKLSASSKDIMDNLPALTLAIEAYNKMLQDRVPDRRQRDFESSRTFSIISPLIDRLLESGEVETAINLIGCYFKIPQAELYSQRPLIIQQNVTEGVRYRTHGKVLVSDTDPLHYGPLLISGLNIFLSQTITVIDDLEHSQAEEPANLGIPDKEHGAELEEILLKHFCLERQDIQELISSVPAYFLFAEFQLPLQALFVRHCNVALPLIQTFRTPYGSREIKKVLIWQSDLPMSQYECDGIQEVFTKKGAEVVRYNWYAHSVQEFATAYGDDSYDLVWISCHGYFDHFAPHSSYLLLSRETDEMPNQRIYLEELAYKRPPELGRRLLSLNACDGATTTLLNSPGSVGFGSSLVNPSQSLMSHQWPIDDYAGLILGLLLGISMAEGNTYIVAYGESISIFLKGKEAVVEILKGHCTDSELFERIENSAKIAFDNLYYYGSLSYME